MVVLSIVMPGGVQREEDEQQEQGQGELHQGFFSNESNLAYVYASEKERGVRKGAILGKSHNKVQKFCAIF